MIQLVEQSVLVGVCLVIQLVEQSVLVGVCLVIQLVVFWLKNPIMDG